MLRVRFSLLPLLTGETLTAVRFRGVAAVKTVAAGTLVTFADGKPVVLAKGSPLASLSGAALTAVTDGLPRCVDDAIAKLGAEAVLSQDGSFSRRLVEYVVVNTPALAELTRDAGGLAEAMTRWLEAARHDYTVTFTLQIDWVSEILGDIQALIEMQLNGAVGVVIVDRVWVDTDGDGTYELYFADAEGNFYSLKNGKMEKAGKLENNDKGSCFKFLWGIMFGKEGPLRIPSFVAAQFLDRHQLRLRELVTDVAAGRRSLQALSEATGALVDITRTRAALTTIPARGGAPVDPSSVQSVRLTAARF